MGTGRALGLVVVAAALLAGCFPSAAAVWNIGANRRIRADLNCLWVDHVVLEENVEWMVGSRYHRYDASGCGRTHQYRATIRQVGIFSFRVDLARDDANTQRGAAATGATAVTSGGEARGGYGGGGAAAGGPVYVHGYTRSNGTYVAPHYRSAPGHGGGRR